MIKAVAFDLDSTLIDSTEAIVNSFLHTFDELALAPAPREAIVGSIGHTLADQFAMITDHDPTECTTVYRAHYKDIACGQTELMPGAADCLARLSDAGLRLGFATSKKREYAEMILKHLDVLHFFETRLGPDDVTHPKPHPEAVLKAAEGLGVAPGDLVFVGDTDFDVRAAHAAGVRCLCVTTGYDTREELEALEPELIVDDLDAIADYILADLH
jgi:2-phosphoglycolate phosphatase